MGLLDVINGMQHGPRGSSTPSSDSSSSSGGMSPMTMAILGLIAWKAIRHFTSGQPGSSTQAPSIPAPPPSGGTIASGGSASGGGLSGGGLGGGGLGDILKGPLGGVLGG